MIKINNQSLHIKIKNLTSTGLLFWMISCNVKKEQCNENLVFRQKFFQSIQDVDDAVNGKKAITRKDYEDALFFLDKYVDVDYDNTLNYRNIYTLYGFKQDRVKWLKWYEENKCDNIQFK